MPGTHRHLLLVLYGGISHLHTSLSPVCAAAAAGSAAVGPAAPGAGGAGLQAEGEQRLQLRVNTLSSFHTRQKLTRQPRHLVFFAGAALADMLLAKLEAVRLQGEATAAKVESTAAKVDVLAAAAPQKEHLTSPSVLGTRALEGLSAATGRAGVFDFPGEDGLPAVLSAAQLTALRAACEADKETGVVRFLTPTLRATVQAAAAIAATGAASAQQLRVLLVNSEAFRWLDFIEQPVSEDKLQKPDLFISWEPFVSFRTAGEKQCSGPEYFFGPLADRSLQLAGCVPVVMEAKKGALTPSDFGELVDYHSHLPGRVNGVLFNHTDFWLTEAFAGHVTRLERCKWGQHGSLALLQRHFAAVLSPPPLAVLLSRLLADLELELLHVLDPTGGRSPFLGAGASGRVFAVCTSDGAHRALKVVVSNEDAVLVAMGKEFGLLQSAAERGAPVVGVVADSFTQYPGQGGGYLLRSIGTPIKLETRASLRHVFSSLQRVHAAGAIHGDPRLPNVVAVDGLPCWIDFIKAAFCPAGFDFSAQEDMWLLAGSVLNRKKHALPDTVGAAVCSYVVADAAAAQRIADAVWAAHPATRR